MAAIGRVRVGLTGLPGLPGVCTFYAIDPIALITPLQTLWNVLLLRMPAAIRVQIETTGDIIEAQNGTLAGNWSTAPIGPQSGGAAGVYVAPAGVCLTWLTQTIADNKRVKGRTYVVPMSQNMYGADGTVEDNNLADVRAAAQVFQQATATNFVIWHRPREAKPADGSRPAITQRNGSHAVVTSAIVRDKIAVLRSRRD